MPVCGIAEHIFTKYNSSWKVQLKSNKWNLRTYIGGNDWLWQGNQEDLREEVTWIWRVFLCFPFFLCVLTFQTLPCFYFFWFLYSHLALTRDHDFSLNNSTFDLIRTYYLHIFQGVDSTFLLLQFRAMIHHTYDDLLTIFSIFLYFCLFATTC